MAVLYITEYENLGGAFNGGPAQMALQPAVAEQTVAIGGASAASSTFNSKTRLVRLHADAICSVEFGSNPTATTAKARMAANQTEYFAVKAGQKVAVISNT